MTISRIINGKKTDIKLTDEELLKAYFIQERLFDIEEVEDYIQECLDENDALEIKKAKEKSRDIAYEFRNMLNQNDTILETQHIVMEYTIKKVLEEYE